MLEEKLRNCFDEMVVYKDLKKSNFFNSLSLPSFMRDWILKKFEDDQGHFDAEQVAEFVKTYPVFYGASYDPNLQDYALTYDAYETIGAEIKMRVNAYKSQITVIKKDSETNKPIEGVEFNIKYKDGTPIGTYKTDKKRNDNSI